MDTTIASVYNRNYNSFSAYTDFTPNSASSIAICGEIGNLQGVVEDNENRSPQSFPQPLQIRYSLHHQDGSSINVIEVQQFNPELKFALKEEEDIFWLNCDAGDILKRFIFKVCITKY